MSEHQFEGSVFMEDGNPPPADYTPARKANVTIRFVADSMGEVDGLATQASDIAQRQLNVMLGRSAPQSKQPVVDLTKLGSVEEAAAATKTTKTRTKAADKPKDTTVEESPEVAAERARLAAELDLTGGDKPAAEDGMADMSAFDVQPEPPAAEVDLTTAQPETTDADLNAAVQKKNSEIDNPQAIRSLIAEYNPDPAKVFQLREIPQDKRAGFLAKLAELKKA